VKKERERGRRLHNLAYALKGKRTCASPSPEKKKKGKVAESLQPGPTTTKD